MQISWTRGKTLGNLAVLNAENKVTIAKQGGVDVIVTAMKQHASVAAVQEYGCWALRNLAENAENSVTSLDPFESFGLWEKHFHIRGAGCKFVTMYESTHAVIRILQCLANFPKKIQCIPTKY